MSTKHKLSIEYIIKDLEELLNKTDEYRSDDLSAIKRTLDLLNRRAVMRIGGKSVVILSDDEIELEQSNTKDSTVFMEDHDEVEEGKYVSIGQVADYFEVTTETVRDWIEKDLLPAHRIGKKGRYKIPREYFEYVKQKREDGFDITEDIMKDVLGDDYSSDWEIDMDEDARE